MKKSIGILLLVCALTLLCAGAAAAESYTVPSGSLSTKLDYLRDIFPHGSYWNHWSASALGSYSQSTFTINGHETSVSTKPCTSSTHNKSGSCNHYWGSWAGIQCTGFGRMMFELLWDMDTETESYGMPYLPDTDDAYLLDYVKPGDMVWTGGHMFVVIGVSDTAYTVVHCNKDGKCMIRWEDTYTKEWVHSKMKGNKTGYVASPTPVKLSSDITEWKTYKVVASSQKMLKWASTSSKVKASCTLKTDEVFYVDVNHTITKSGKQFAYSRTSSGNYGWVVINDASLCVEYELKATTVDNTPRIAVSTKKATGNSKDDQCYVKAAPYESEKTLRVEDKDDIIYLSGCVTNSYGNTWYVTEDGGYIYTGDLEIKVADASIKSEKNRNAAAVSVSETCRLKEKPFSAARHSATLAKGKTVEIIAEVVNAYDNVWYRTSDGAYVYSGDVEVFDADFSVYTTINAKFSWQEAAYTRALPYSGMPKVKEIVTGQVVTVKRMVLNDYGNLWAQLDDGTYLCYYDKASGVCYGKFWDFTADPCVTLTGAKLPSGEIKQGSDFTLAGVVESANGCPIAAVEAYITMKGGAVVGQNSADFRASSPRTSVDLTKQLDLNSKFDFAGLEPGEYTLTVRVIMGFVYDGDQLFFSNSFYPEKCPSYHIVASSQFTVVGESQPETPPVTPDSGSITMSVPASTGAQAGKTVTVPVSINNPDGVVLGSIVLNYKLPAGISVQDVTMRKANATVQLKDPSQLIVLEGVTEDVIDVAFALAESAALPAEITVTPAVVRQADDVQINLSSFKIKLEKKNDRVPGDVTGNGVVDYGDLLRLAKHLANWSGIEVNLSNADCTGNGTVDYGDLLRLAKWLANWDVTLE